MSDRSSLPTGTVLLLAAAALFVLTRVIVWLPLGFVGTFINGIIWPFILLAGVGGGFLTWRRLRRGDRRELHRRS